MSEQWNYDWVQAALSHPGTIKHFSRFSNECRFEFQIEWGRVKAGDNDGYFELQVLALTSKSLAALNRGRAQFEPEMLVVKTLEVAPFNSEEGKRASIIAAGRALGEMVLMPLVAFLCYEGWADRQEADAPHVEPRLSPDRREMLLITSLTVDHAVRMQIYDLKLRRGVRTPVLVAGEMTQARSGILEHFYAGYVQYSQERMAAFHKESQP